MLPLQITYGLSILLFLPLVFHFITFRKSTKFIYVLSSILIGEYVLTVFMISFGLLNLFNVKWILIGSFLSVCIVGSYIKKKEVIKLDSIRISQGDIKLILFFVFFVLIVQKYTTFANDTLMRYFPWARIIVQENSIPAFNLVNNFEYVIHYPPLLYSHIALLFSAQGNYSLAITDSIPIFYSSLTMLLLLIWGHEYGHKHASMFTIISLFGIWPVFSIYSSLVLQEAPILFFTTSSFYLLFKYWKTKKDVFLILLAVSSSLGMLTKYSGFVISPLILCALFMKSSNKKEAYKIGFVFTLFAAPVFLWSLRNLYFYGNPVFPLLTNVFKSEFSELWRLYLISDTDYLSISPVLGYLRFIKGFLACFSVISVFSFIYMYKNKRSYETKFVFSSFIFFLFALLISEVLRGDSVRFIFPFVGIFALYSSVETSRLYDSVPVKILKKKKEMIIVFFLLFLVAFSLIRIHNHYGSMNEFTGHRGVLEYLTENKIQGEELRVLGGAHTLLIWHENITVIAPNTLLFLVLNDGNTFEYGANSEYYYKLFSKLGIEYVYVSSEETCPRCTNSPKSFIEQINNDEKYFELVFVDGEHRLWRVKKSVYIQ